MPLDGVIQVLLLVRSGLLPRQCALRLGGNSLPLRSSLDRDAPRLRQLRLPRLPLLCLAHLLLLFLGQPGWRLLLLLRLGVLEIGVLRRPWYEQRCFRPCCRCCRQLLLLLLRLASRC